MSDSGLPVPPGFDISKAPYAPDSGNGGNLASLQAIGASVQWYRSRATLVRTVSQKNTITNSNQLLHFIVPQSPRITTSTLMIPGVHGDRLAPEYVEYTAPVILDGPVTQTPKDLNTLGAAAFATAMANGGYAAVHFTDDTCDGWCRSCCEGSNFRGRKCSRIFVDYSAGFYPLADQLEVKTYRSIRQVKPLSKREIACESITAASQ